MARSLPATTSRPAPVSSPTTSAGMSPMPARSGLSAPTPTVPTCSSTRPRPSSTSRKSRTRSSPVSSGPPVRVPSTEEPMRCHPLQHPRCYPPRRCHPPWWWPDHPHCPSRALRRHLLAEPALLEPVFLVEIRGSRAGHGWRLRCPYPPERPRLQRGAAPRYPSSPSRPTCPSSESVRLQRRSPAGHLWPGLPPVRLRPLAGSPWWLSSGSTSKVGQIVLDMRKRKGLKVEVPASTT